MLTLRRWAYYNAVEELMSSRIEENRYVFPFTLLETIKTLNTF